MTFLRREWYEAQIRKYLCVGKRSLCPEGVWMKRAEAGGGGWDADNPTCAQSAHCSSRKGNVVRLPSSFVILSFER